MRCSLTRKKIYGLQFDLTRLVRKRKPRLNSVDEEVYYVDPEVKGRSKQVVLKKVRRPVENATEEVFDEIVEALLTARPYIWRATWK